MKRLSGVGVFSQNSLGKEMNSSKIFQIPFPDTAPLEQVVKVANLSRCALACYQNAPGQFSTKGYSLEYVGFDCLDGYNYYRSWLEQYNWNLEDTLRAWHNDPDFTNQLHPKARELICDTKLKDFEILDKQPSERCGLFSLLIDTETSFKDLNDLTTLSAKFEKFSNRDDQTAMEDFILLRKQLEKTDPFPKP